MCSKLTSGSLLKISPSVNKYYSIFEYLKTGLLITF